MENSQSLHNNFIYTDRKSLVKCFVVEKPKAIGKPDRKGKITYIPEPKYESKWKTSKPFLLA